MRRGEREREREREREGRERENRRKNERKKITDLFRLAAPRIEILRTR